MTALYVLPLVVQGIAMLVDEAWFHRRRGLPRWERIGHPLDTLTIAACLGWLLAGGGLAGYVVLAIGSTLFVTKDEPVHAKLCTGGEQWLHAVLFALHPVVLAAFVMLPHALLAGELAVVSGFLVYQAAYWNLPREHEPAAAAINNTWYADLGARWYEAEDTPIALLRAEARHRNPWIAGEIARVLGRGSQRVLDLGCGAGFLANDLAARGHLCTGIDTTAENLAVARARDGTRSVAYRVADARALPFATGSFDVACAMDLLEHVEQPERVVREAARVLRPGGMLFFHTFNKTWLANLIVIKGVEAFVANTPKGLHVLRLFIPPEELERMCREHGLDVVDLRGSRPRFRWPLWRMLATGKVGEDFSFAFTRSTALGYTGYARKRAELSRALPARTPASTCPPRV